MSARIYKAEWPPLTHRLANLALARLPLLLSEVLRLILDRMISSIWI
jgi:hypothetical protein